MKVPFVQDNTLSSFLIKVNLSTKHKFNLFKKLKNNDFFLERFYLVLHALRTKIKLTLLVYLEVHHEILVETTTRQFQTNILSEKLYDSV